MELPVLIEPLSDRPGYAAQLGAPFHLQAEAGTAEDARQQLAVLLQRRLQGGATLGAISVPAGLGSAVEGWLADDTLTQQWLQQVQQHRQECDEADRRRLLGDAGQEKAVS
ncbi:MAG: hypothetical protein HYS12_07115 [Planctomycetes bacterium]|nr:hypothetical protein [Planctomycetota bacterium]